MNDSEDVKRIEEAIRKHKIEAEDPDEPEYAEFIDYTGNNGPDDPTEIDDYDIPNFPKSDITQFPTYNPVSFLTNGEKEVVESCPDLQLKRLLFLNRNKNIQLMQLYKKIKDLLVECQQNITMKEEFIAAAYNSKRVFNRIWRLGIPYFKSKDNFPCPRNAEIIKKHSKGELLFYDMAPSNKWLEKDMNRLLKGVAFHYKFFKTNELDKRIKKLDKEIAAGNCDTDKEELFQELQKEMEGITTCKDDIYPPLGCDKNLDWYRIAEGFLRERYSAQDCQIFWNSYLHPEINKGPWTPEENEKLKKLAAKYNFNNWDLIAAELGNNRTGFIACVHYFCKVDPPRQGRFTEAEDKRLCDLVELYKQGDYIPWTKVAHHFRDRTRTQLFYRYKYFLSCRSGKIKGKFSEAEDILILVLVDRFGKKFAKCAEYFPHRSVVQIKARYTSNLRGAIKKGSFSIEEDREILKFVEENGTSNWEALVKRLNRYGAQIRQRYKTLTLFMKAHPGVDLEKAPRRRFNAISFDNEYDFIRCTADKFKQCEKIPALRDIEKLLSRNPKPKGLLGPLPHHKTSARVLRVRKEKVYKEIDSGNGEEEITQSEKGKASEWEQQGDCERIKDKLPQPDDDDDDDDDDTFSDVNLSVDHLLVDFFSNSLKLNFEQSLGHQHMRQAAASVNQVLSTLQTKLHIPMNFAEDSHLDSIDLEILKILTENESFNTDCEYVIGQDKSEIERLIPPNLYSVVGMRSLLIKNQIYKSRNARRAHIFEDFKAECKEKQVRWCIDNHLSNQSRDTRQALLSERQLFFQRFVSLFKFPAIMTLQRPSEVLETTSRGWREELNRGVRTYRKRLPRLALAEDNNPTFQSVLIKGQPQDYDSKCSSQPITSTGDTNLSRSYQSKGRSKSSSATNEPTNTPRLSIVEQLKRRINDTIDELSSLPPSKKFYNNIEIIPFKRPAFGSQTAANENGEHPQTSKTYASKNRVKPKVMARDQAVARANRTRENVIEIKCEALQDVDPVREEAHSSFNLSRGELVLENDSPCRGSNSINQDAIDLSILEAVLKKENNSAVPEECFEF